MDERAPVWYNYSNQTKTSQGGTSMEMKKGQLKELEEKKLHEDELEEVAGGGDDKKEIVETEVQAKRRKGHLAFLAKKNN